MKNLTALVALLAVLPSVGAAQTKIGVVAETSLSVGGAPTAGLTSGPALTLSPASLSAASLTPSLVAAPQALALIPAAVLPAASMPAKPGAAPALVNGLPAPVKDAALPRGGVPAALTVLKPAEARPEKPGSDEAAAAQTALFDGAKTLKAATVDRDPIAGSEGAGRAPLRAPTDGEIAAAWKDARPKSKAIDAFGKDFTAAAAEAVQKYTFMGEYFLQQFDPKGRGMLDFKGRAIASSIADFVSAHDDRENPASVKFMRLLGAWMAHHDSATELAQAPMLAMMKKIGRGPAPHLTPSPIEGGEYWDMAAGMNALGFIHRELDPKTSYSFFDYSPFVVSYLKTAAAIKGVKNLVVVEGDIGALQKPAKPIAVLRTKNAVHYVPGFAKKLEEMADWIAPGGQLVIQNDPNPGQRSLIVDGHGALIRRLLSEGWGIEYGFSGYDGVYGKYALDTLVLTRPKAPSPRSAADAAESWSRYRAAVARIDADTNPFAFLFR